MEKQQDNKLGLSIQDLIKKTIENEKKIITEIQDGAMKVIWPRFLGSDVEKDWKFVRYDRFTREYIFESNSDKGVFIRYLPEIKEAIREKEGSRKKEFFNRKNNSWESFFPEEGKHYNTTKNTWEYYNAVTGDWARYLKVLNSGTDFEENNDRLVFSRDDGDKIITKYEFSDTNFESVLEKKMERLRKQGKSEQEIKALIEEMERNGTTLKLKKESDYIVIYNVEEKRFEYYDGRNDGVERSNKVIRILDANSSEPLAIYVPDKGIWDFEVGGKRLCLSLFTGRRYEKINGVYVKIKTPKELEEEEKQQRIQEENRRKIEAKKAEEARKQEETRKAAEEREKAEAAIEKAEQIRLENDARIQEILEAMEREEQDKPTVAFDPVEPEELGELGEILKSKHTTNYMGKSRRNIRITSDTVCMGRNQKAIRKVSKNKSSKENNKNNVHDINDFSNVGVIERIQKWFKNLLSNDIPYLKSKVMSKLNDKKGKRNIKGVSKKKYSKLLIPVGAILALGLGIGVAMKNLDIKAFEKSLKDSSSNTLNSITDTINRNDNRSQNVKQSFLEFRQNSAINTEVGSEIANGIANEIVNEVANEESNEQIKEEESLLTTGSRTKKYSLLGGTQYFATSQADTDINIFRQDLDVEIFNRAIVQENKDGTTSILLVSMGMTWEEFAKENNMSMTEIENLLKSQGAKEMVAVQIPGVEHNIFNTYGWTEASNLKDKEKENTNNNSYDTQTTAKESDIER